MDSPSFSNLPHPAIHYLLLLLTIIDTDILSMKEAATAYLPFTSYPILKCQSTVSGLTQIISTHPIFIQNRSLYRVIMKLMYSLFNTTLTIVADSQINEHGEGEGDEMSELNELTTEDLEEVMNTEIDEVASTTKEGEENEDEEEKGMKELLSKGPVHAFSIQSQNGDVERDETVITESDHIAKNKLDCRGHIIGETTPEQSRHLMRLMLSCWLNCKYASLAIAEMFVLLPDACFEVASGQEGWTDQCMVKDLRKVKSWFAGVYSFEEEANDNGSDVNVGTLPHLSNQDILFVVWDILMSVLTIKHIGGIVFVAEAIAKIITRFTKMVGVNDFLASLPGLFVDILLDEENINNRNFILRRSTGFSKAICSVSYEYSWIF